MSGAAPVRPLGAVPPAVAAALVLGSYLAVRSGATEVVDREVERRLTSVRHRRGDHVLVVATDLGSTFGLIGTSTVLALTGRRTAAAEVSAAGTAAWVLAQAVKPALGRPRPYELGSSVRLVSPPAGSSWPSGHAAVGAAMATALITLGDRRLALLAAAGAVGIGVSRISVGVHHLSDVVAGWGVGVLAAACSGAITRRLRLRTR
ncbi:MAG: phosphatase PAP2 family protein [Nitriliruptoraceae bacterium]